MPFFSPTPELTQRMEEEAFEESSISRPINSFRDVYRGTQRIVSVNCLFGRSSIPSDFLTRIVASNFRDMRNLMSVVFGLLKMSF